MFLALMLLAGPPVQTGPVTAEVALNNRQAIEAGSQLPPVGQVQLDQALAVKSGMALDGGTLKNQYKSDQYPLNCTVQCYGAGVGYADTITRLSATRWAVVDPNALANYQVGNAVHCFRYDGYFDAVGQLCARRTIVAKVGNVITLSAGIDPRCDRAKWYAQGAPIIQDVRAGQLAVSLPSTAQASTFSPGDYVLVTSGADVANADHCEAHRVTQVLNFSVYLDSPTQRAYKSAVLAKYTPTRGVELKNLTIEAPVNAGATGAFFKYLTNSRFENVTFNGGLALGGCSQITLVNCRINGELGVNSCHGVTLVGCQAARLACEEAAFDVTCSGCTFGPSEVPLQTSVGCERHSFTACKVTGGSMMPVSVGGPDMRFEDFAIEGTTRSLYAYFSGDRLRVRGLRCDPNCEPVLYGGSAISLQGIMARQANLGWIDGSASSGTVLDCQAPLVRQGSWRVVP